MNELIENNLKDDYGHLGTQRLSLSQCGYLRAEAT